MRTVWSPFLTLAFVSALAIGLSAGVVRAQQLAPEADEQVVVPDAPEPKGSDQKVVPPRAYESGAVIVTAETAEVREGPSPRAEVLTVVERGDILEKQGRTGGWYYIQLGEDSFGWISGRQIRRYRPSGTPAPYVGPSYGWYYPSYPGDYYGYPYYWGDPFFRWDWYYYDYEPYRGRDYYRRDDHRDRDRTRTWRDDRDRDDWNRGKVYRDNDSRRRGDIRRRSVPDHVPRPPLRGPFQRR